VRGTQDVTDALDIPCIGLIPQIRRKGRRRPHQHLLANPFGPYAEAIRSVAASLPLATSRGLPKAIMVSSSLPQEGKTTLAVSLAVYAAALGRRTVLVDLDFRRPAIWREVGGDSAGKTLEPLDNDSGASVALLNMPNLGLHVLAMRRPPDDPLSAFASGQLTSLLDHLRARYDCIVMDTPPLLAVAETRLLATLADKILFVVKWGSTRRAVARNALDLLRDTRILGAACNSMVSAVITQVDVRRHAQYRYGDAVESYARHAQYYLKAASATGPQNLPAQRTSRDETARPPTVR
jgi:Mrp family chromosome partitioning ATPase